MNSERPYPALGAAQSAAWLLGRVLIVIALLPNGVRKVASFGLTAAMMGGAPPQMVDGRPLNNHFWVFRGGLSDVDYTIRVTDTATGTVRTYRNLPNSLTSGADTSAF